MKLNDTVIKTLLLILLSNFSLAQESCKGGFCMVSLDSLDKGKVSKKVKIESTSSKIGKNKEINEKTKIKLSVK